MMTAVSNNTAPAVAAVRLAVTGRACLIGEHSDWAAEYRVGDEALPRGNVLTVGTNQAITAFASRSKQVVVEADGLTFRRQVEALDGVENESYWAYVARTADIMHNMFHVPPVRLSRVRSTLPEQKGLSSSAAICVMVVEAYNQLYRLRLSHEGIMELAYQGERATGSQCGRMDQLCAYGHMVIHTIFHGTHMERTRIMRTRNHDDGFKFLLVDLGGEKDTKKILHDLNAAYRRGDGGIIGYMNESYRITEQALQHLKKGSLAHFGGCMNYIQDLFDRVVAPLCGELASPRLKALRLDEDLAQLAYGIKGMGSQGDGTALVLCRSANERAQARIHLQSTYEMACFDLDV